jgi:hypothetical protein
MAGARQSSLTSALIPALREGRVKQQVGSQQVGTVPVRLCLLPRNFKARRTTTAVGCGFNKFAYC